MVLFTPWCVLFPYTTLFRSEFWFIGFGGATLLDRIGPPGRCSGGWPHDRNSWLMPRVNPPASTAYITLTHARGQVGGRPVATGTLANEMGRAKKRPGSPACFLSAIS